MIIQGSNNPIVIQFDTNIEDIPALVITLWRDKAGYTCDLVKKWEADEIAIDGDTAVCQLTEAETRLFPPGEMVIEAKGLDENGNTIFWDQYRTDVMKRRDKVIILTQTQTQEEQEETETTEG